MVIYIFIVYNIKYNLESNSLKQIKLDNPTTAAMVV